MAYTPTTNGIGSDQSDDDHRNAESTPPPGRKKPQGRKSSKGKTPFPSENDYQVIGVIDYIHKNRLGLMKNIVRKAQIQNILAVRRTKRGECVITDGSYGRLYDKIERMGIIRQLRGGLVEILVEDVKATVDALLEKAAFTDLGGNEVAA